MGHELSITVERDGKHFIESSVDPGKILEGPFATAQAAEQRARQRSKEFNPDRNQQIIDALNAKKGRDQQIIDAFRQRAPGLAKVARRTLLEQEKFEFLKKELVEQGVDIESGGPMGPRAELALTPIERQEIVLDNAFGQNKWRVSDLGVVVTMDTENGPQEILLDEAGFSVKDFADMAGSGPEVAGSVATAVGVAALFPELLAGGALSLLIYSAIVAAGGQIVGGTSDLAFSLKNGGLDFAKEEDRDLIINIAKRRGTQAAVDTVLDFAMAGGARLLSPKGRALITSPQKEVAEAAERRGVPLSVGEKTGSTTFMRAEALTEKVPGATGPAIKLQKKTSAAMRGEIDKAVGAVPDSETVGRAFSDELTDQFDRRVAEINRIDDEAGKLIDRRLSDLQTRMASRGLSSSEAGEMSRRTIQRQRLSFKKKQRIIEDHAQSLIDKLDVEKQAFVPAGDIKATAIKLKGEFPKDAKGRAIDEFLPPELKAFFRGVDKLPDKMTVPELRNLRTLLANAIDDSAALPGVGQGVLKQLEAATTRALREAVDKAPNDDIKYFLGQAVEHYRINNSRFRTAAVARTFRTEERAGFVENEDVLPGLMKKNRVEDAQRVLRVIGADSPAAKVSRRAVFQDMIHASQNHLLKKGVTDAKRLASEFDKLNPAMREIVFGDKAGEVGQLIRLMAARGGDFDLEDILLSPATKDIGDILRDATAKELSLRSDFERGVIKPILRGEMDITKLAPENFVRHVLKTGSFDDARALFRLAPPELQDAFRRRAIIQVLEMAEKSAGEATDKILAFSMGANPSEKILDVMRKGFGPDADISLKKLRFILGDEGFNLMRDMGVIAAARARKADAAKAVGGLVGGSILSKLLTFQISTGIQIGSYRVVSVLLRNRVTRAWLSNSAAFKGKGALQAAAAVTPQITRAITEEFGEDSEEARKWNAFFRGEIKIGGTTFRQLIESAIDESEE